MKSINSVKRNRTNRNFTASDVSGDNFEVLPTCGHSFCRDCLSRHCSALISDSAMERLVCPDQDCDKERKRETESTFLFRNKI